MEDFLSAADVARRLGVTTGAVRLMLRTGRLPAAGRTEGGINLFRQRDVERLSAERDAAKRDRAARGVSA